MALATNRWPFIQVSAAIVILATSCGGMEAGADSSVGVDAARDARVEPDANGATDGGASVDARPDIDGGSTPTTDHPFEPAGAIVLLDWLTDFGALEECNYCGDDAFKPWTYVGGAPNLETITDETAPVDPTTVGRVTLEPGCCAGSGPAHLINDSGVRGPAAGYGLPPADWEQWYISTWFKLVDYDPSGDYTQKIWSVVTDGGGGIESMHVEVNGLAYPLTLGVVVQIASEPTTSLVGSFEVEPDVWYEVIELYTKSSGRYQQWVRPMGGTAVENVDRTQTFSWSNEFVRFWWGHGGLGAYAGSTPGYFHHNRIYMSFTT